MKKSQELKLKSSQEDNDIVAFGLLNKAIREERIEKFEESYLDLLSKEYQISYDKNSHKYSIDATNTKFKSILDFYPKANKVLIRKQNRWIKPGLKWLIQHLLSKE